MKTLIECPWVDEFMGVFSPCVEDDGVKLAAIRSICIGRNGAVFVGMNDGEIQGFIVLEKDGDAGIIHTARAIKAGHDLVTDYFPLIMETFDRWQVSIARFTTFRKGLMKKALPFGFRPKGVVFERALNGHQAN